ncbi:MAG: hypothetical protein ACFCVG_18860 [Kineosporiaceae bacterium]
MRSRAGPPASDRLACETATPAATTGETVTIQAVFDGWGYVRLFATDIPRSPRETPTSRTTRAGSAC